MSSVTAIDPGQVMTWVTSGEAVLIDVREPSEFAAGHIPHALSIPLASVATSLSAMRLPADRRIVFQCQKGGRGGQACVAVGATSPGGQPVFNLTGGIEAWTAAGLPVVGPVIVSRTLPVMRQVQIAVGLLVALSVVVGFAIHPAGFAVAGLFGAALATAGATGWCGMALLLQRAPWNRVA